MHTDPQIYTLLSADPEILAILTGGLRVAGPYHFEALDLKAIERRTDGVLLPDRGDQPIWIIEFQAQRDATIYYRLVTELGLVGERYPQRLVYGLILFATPELDPRSEPWFGYARSEAIAGPLRVVYLDEILERLAQRDPSHPLLTVFLPYRVSSAEQLTAAAPTAYQRIQASAYPEPTKTALFEVLTAWLGARFPHLSYREVLQMFQIEHTFEESQIYKDLIAIGENRGITIGESRLVLRLLRRRLGEVPESLERRIRGLASPQLEALGEALLDFRSRADLERWLDAQPEPEADDPAADPAG